MVCFPSPCPCLLGRGEIGDKAFPTREGFIVFVGSHQSVSTFTICVAPLKAGVILSALEQSFPSRE